MNVPKERYLIICGPTASGKSKLALELAKELNGSLVCCDSVQFYKGMVIGAAGPTPEEIASVPHHLFYSLELNESFDAASFRHRALAEMRSIWNAGRLPIVVGGTGLYMRALIGRDWHQDLPHDPKVRAVVKELSDTDLLSELQQRDPQRFKEIHAHDRFRLERAVELCRLLGKPVSELAQGNDTLDSRAFIIQLIPERKILHQRIEDRTNSMLAMGLINEVEQLLGTVDDPSLCKPLQSIGYKQVIDYKSGLIHREELAEKIVFASRQYAKRQCTWFKKMPRNLLLNQMPASVQELISNIRKNF